MEPVKPLFKECQTTQMHADSKKQSSFLALLFAAGDLGR